MLALTKREGFCEQAGAAMLGVVLQLLPLGGTKSLLVAGEEGFYNR